MANEAKVYSVSHLTGMIQDALRRSVPPLWVRGEISDLARPHSGHLYFTLKDASSQIRCVMWRSNAEQLPAPLADGQSILCFGELDVYGPRGSYQLIVRQAEPVGQGQLQQRLLALRKKLTAEGLFAAELKRPLPRFPRHVGVVSSPTGAAIQDFLHVLKRRWRGLRVSLTPCRVQGQGSASEIAAAIRAMGRLRPAIDVLVVTRGGGSLEDLWSFNEEAVVRAVRSCPVPVVSAIGHEIDVTLSDLAADVRALTPSEAAERVAPSRDDVEKHIESLADRLVGGLQNRASAARARVELLAQSPVLTRPLDRIRHLEQRLDELAERKLQAIQRLQERKRAVVSRLAAELDALSPLAVLGRGYSMTRDADEQIVVDASTLQTGDLLITRFAAGSAVSRVEQLAAESIEPIQDNAAAPTASNKSKES